MSSRAATTSLTRAYLRDLAIDIRCARRDNLGEYARAVVREFRELWTTRHNARLSRYGVPNPTN